MSPIGSRGLDVYVDGVKIGQTPAEYSFTHYGPRALLLAKAGYESLAPTCELNAPWWAYFPIDIFAELWPGRIVDRHEISYALSTAAEGTSGMDALRRNLGAAAQRLSPEPE